MSLPYIRNYYGLKVKRGDLAYIKDGDGFHPVTVIGSRGSHLRVRYHSNPKKIETRHPTAGIEYDAYKVPGDKVL